ncbi:MAG: carboxyltransferase domain-containing protein [Myxococcota bacterium]|nr:carboxyltransferase domain-containing protein [Deltaproteobacteria bacterium]MDQ3337588.1 carboxyltransferase domain-containing protein [Myxococcota bacterium]
MVARLGDRAILLPRPTGISARAIVTSARDWDGVVDVVVTRDEVAVYFDREPHVGTFAASDDDAAESRLVELRAHYDGPDLEDVARAIDTTTDDVVQLHLAPTYVVETIGFAPGFAYLVGLDARLGAIPRRASPRSRVPAGSLAIAGGYTAVYPFDSPGGWNLLGRVSEHMFTAEAGARLRLGDRVRFVR